MARPERVFTDEEVEMIKSILGLDNMLDDRQNSGGENV